MRDKASNILELQDVTKTFSNSQFCLDKVSFELPYGAIMGFVGENGAGKTTTISCIINALKKDNGIIRLFGRELSDEDIDLKEKIGVVYDASNFSGSLTPSNLSNIMQGVYRQWDNSLFKKHMEIFKLPLKQKIATFSKGMTMKLALAVAISHSPKLLILDEATSGLDPIVRDEILDVFLDFVQDDSRSIFLSSHITSDLEKVADYITFIHNGKILLSAPKDELVYKYGILRCKSSQFEQVDKNDILAYRKRDYQIDVLVHDRNAMQQKYKGLITDNATIDDILLMLVRGGKYDRSVS
jgi:ABC-2 type transport system ATP-binding protein